MTHVTKEFRRVHPKQLPSLWYIWRKPCTCLALTQTPSLNGPNEIPLGLRHLGLPSGVSKMIFKAMLRLAQFVHLSCSDNNIISKWTETRFDMTHVT
jgi:hypothetical protein